MKRGIRYLLAAGLGGIVLAYSGAVGFLAYSETSMVFASAGESPLRRWLPAEDSEMRWDSLRARAADGVPVFLLEIRIDDSPLRPWALYFHGNAGLLGSRGNVARYKLLREAGFNVLAVEYRGYGASASAGRPSESGLYADATGAWQHLTQTLGVDRGRIVVYGWSLGSGPAMYIAKEKRPAAVITEGAFTSLPDVGAALYPWVPVRFIMRNRFDNLQRARTIEIPWLVLHGRADTEIPFAHAERLAAVGGSVDLVPLTAGHDDGAIGDRAASLAALRAMLQRVVALADSAEIQAQ